MANIFNTIGKIGLALAVAGGVVQSALYNGRQNVSGDSVASFIAKNLSSAWIDRPIAGVCLLFSEGDILLTRILVRQSRMFD